MLSLSQFTRRPLFDNSHSNVAVCSADVTCTSTSSRTNFTATAVTYMYMQAFITTRSVVRGGGSRGPCPQLSIEWIMCRKKLALLGCRACFVQYSHIVLSTRRCSSCGPQIFQKCVGGWAPRRTPLGELTTLPEPLVGWEGRHPLPIPSYTLRRLDSRTLGTQLLCQCRNVKYWLRPWYIHIS